MSNRTTEMSQMRNGNNTTEKTPFETEVIILNQCRKLNGQIFIQRDYSKGLDVQFETEYPARLTEKVPRDVWESTITNINTIFSEAEAITTRSIFETVFGCMTCYASYLFLKSRYTAKLEKLQRVLDVENERIYHPVGFHIRNPMERGLRVLEIAHLMRQGETPRDEPEIQEPSRPSRTI
uniref:Ras modification protein ERF4 n=1 Tax=Caenorhabditis tropicalis TaxID=1561998 RepID=A0A1I7V0P8_9PELO